MNFIKRILFKVVFLLLVPATAWVSCKDNEIEEMRLPRMFKPARFTISAGETSVHIQWRPSLFASNGETEYLIEVSKDGVNFSGVEFTKTTASPEVTILDTDIDIRTDYFARVKAIGKNGTDDSNWLVSGVFRITGEIFIQPVNENDVLVDVARIRWDVRDVITKIVITPQGGEPFEVTVSPEEAEEGEKIVSGLTGGTKYIVEIFKGEVSKGFITFQTKPSYAEYNVVDLTEITGNPDILAETLAVIPSGSVVLLRRGEQYTISTHNIDRSVTITSGADFNPEFATIFMTNSFNMVAGSNIDSLVFRDVNITGEDYAADYVFNINQVGMIGTVKFENVRGHRLRGFFRLQTGGAGTQVENFIMNNCVVDSLRDFSLVNTNNSNTVANISVTNTTIYHARKVIDHRSPGSNSILFENCTFYNLPTGGAAGAGSFYFIDLDTRNSTNPIVIRNCIFGKSRDEGMGGDDARGIRVGTSTTVNVENSYRTSDFISTNEAFQIPSLIGYSGTSDKLFANPSAGDFTIIDPSFAGATSAGDPRWRQ